MISNDFNIDEIPYMYDQSGRICVKGNKVYRIIEDKEHINNYKELLNSDYIEELFSIGLVRTKIVEELYEKGIIILEHQKIPFILHPCEYSNKMFWQAACMFIEMNLKLSEKGFVTQDSHPWNISFNGNKPIFYDFGSIIKRNNISQSWVDEFFQYFIVPIWLASYSPKTYKFAKEYRREHVNGFGLSVFKSKIIGKILFRRFKSISKFKNDPQKLFEEIFKWLHKHEPISVRPEYWSDYYKTHDLDYDNPKSIKQKFVYKVLSNAQPEKVLDLASNKGYYAFMAASLGASVIAFDYEEEIIDFLLTIGNSNNKVTPAHMDFNKPTAAHGAGLFQENSFKRFTTEIVLSLGLIHHICLTQGVPVYLFCETCKKYASKGIVLEFVDPTDKHVANWNVKIPKDYSIDKIKVYMKDKFSNCEICTIEKSEGLNRTYLYFYN
jgi:SAM-dependent methyltransferase